MGEFASQSRSAAAWIGGLHLAAALARLRNLTVLDLSDNTLVTRSEAVFFEQTRCRATERARRWLKWFGRTLASFRSAWTVALIPRRGVLRVLS